MKEKMIKEIQQNDPEIEPEEVEAKFEQEIEFNGLTKDINSLICEAYTEEQIHEDEETTRECFEWAYEEVQKAEEEKNAQLMFE